MAIIGVDEAGKGPVIGSMFVVAARIRSERDLPNNVLDSKKLTPKLREEIAKDLSDDDFKKRYGGRWKEVKMAVATKMAKKESFKT